jgi:phosphoenolpyruvate-protein kinase (PTS system EI component)
VFKGVELSYFNLGALAGFTTENGGFLSHAATIAREFKIPYITGISFEELEDGIYVILDTENEQVIY